MLFGTVESISNYSKSIDYLFNKSPSIDYLVCSYEKLNLEHAANFKENLNRYKNFLFIPHEDYQLIYQKLIFDARSFMKKKD